MITRAGALKPDYDVVAYFTDGKPVKGFPEFTCPWMGITWQFARAGFAREPAKCAPQCGGYCAYAVALGNVVDVDPKP